MPILEFNHLGYLPAGIHRATLDEVEARFGRATELRRIEMESIRWLASDCPARHIARMLINGSFVTDAPEPNDVDCVLLADESYELDQFAEDIWLSSYPFISFHVVNPQDYAIFANEIFGTDRAGIIKGIVEVLL